MSYNDNLEFDCVVNPLMANDAFKSHKRFESTYLKKAQFSQEKV